MYNHTPFFFSGCNMLKIGDFLKGTREADGRYSVTNESMTLGIVSYIYDCRLDDVEYVDIVCLLYTSKPKRNIWNPRHIQKQRTKKSKSCASKRAIVCSKLMALQFRRLSFLDSRFSSWMKNAAFLTQFEMLNALSRSIWTTPLIWQTSNVLFLSMWPTSPQSNPLLQKQRGLAIKWTMTVNKRPIVIP